ncbi:hypothetical protein WA1_35965 [Scytonema hofmannii PCC 7110]|uniref:CRISPR-associated protein Cas3 n=1 Tax=Scytonema hofmannii PCC 7110 TaxID=128403 RepID=A0A139X1N1_9CYAN|nr:CRISPR-associated helicase/endonuclease Cas3 [Scytonema hofmannii]KYC38584.1 hypothetical protein WA1_35965 [Scytonema hofmannii PCC 7110]
MVEFRDWFEQTSGKPPFPYQEHFATQSELPILLDVITGAGKTATVVLGWLWRRRFYPDQRIRDRTPRRLVYCLPMRTLVEQTYAEIEKWLKKAGLEGDAELHLLMGGAISKRWDIHPEKDCILVGTQDQLLSRALNRGYAMSRYRWPVQFALVNNDCLWVMDEVQLMGAGVRTTAQLQGFREKFGTYGLVASLWMSATLDSELLKTVDYQPDLNRIHRLSEEDESHPVLQKRLQAKKRLVRAETVIQGKEEDTKALASEVAKLHIPGTLTILICNRVTRAQAVYQELSHLTSDSLLLLHSRFRPCERQELNQKLYKFRVGIIVATQAIEAGIDISAKTLISELTSWFSFVQRVGRCNRYGEYSDGATVYWVDIDTHKKQLAAPYQVEFLEEARKLLSQIEEGIKDVGPLALGSVKPELKSVEGLIPRKNDLLQLFDTSTDLAGHDIDISPFIRSSNELDVAIAWRDWEEGKPKDSVSGALRQEELCRVSLRQAQAFLDRLIKNKSSAWVWDGSEGDWVKASRLYPGIAILVKRKDGGYSTTLGFTGNPTDEPNAVNAPVIKPEKDDSDWLTEIKIYITLSQHSHDVELRTEELCLKLNDSSLPVPLLKRSGRWHDLGKAHEVFQALLTDNRLDKQTGGPWAKSDKMNRGVSKRPGFRHELVSALVALQQNEPDLLAYLVAAHHGRIRMTIQPVPYEKQPDEPNRKFARGVWEGDTIPAVDLGGGLEIPEQILSLDCMTIGDVEGSSSWTARAIALLNEYGPFKLAFLETIIRVADWRASETYRNDILGETDA